MIQAARYARYSTDHQTDNSIAYQFAKIDDYCREHKINVVASYSDEGQSGTNMDRDGFLDMVTAAARHEFDAVVIYDISRGSRDVGDWFAFRKQMQRLGVQVISATQSLGDVTNPNDFLVELITVGLGEHQVLDTRQKSIAGTAVRAGKGLFCGGTPPLGYDIKNGAYIINEQEADSVRIIFSEYASGSSYNQIIDKLHGRCGKSGSPIGKNCLCDILQNERYIGIYSWNKEIRRVMRKWAGGKPNPHAIRIEGVIPPIIDAETWRKVRQRMSHKERKASNKATHEYLLTGLIECTQCGATYVGHCSTNKRADGSKRENRYYVCGNKYRTRTCDAHNINADEIETFVVSQLKAYLLEADFSEIAKKIADSVNDAAPDLKKERSELSSIDRQISNGVKAVLSGMDAPELRDEIDRLRTRKSELNDIITSKSATHGRRVDPKKIEAMFQSAVENWDDNHVKGIIQNFVTKIYADPDGSYTVEIGVHTTGAGSGGRTHTVSPPRDFESRTSANSIIPANTLLLYYIIVFFARHFSH